MATGTTHQHANVGRSWGGSIGAVPEADWQGSAPRLTSEQVWKAIAKGSFAVLSCVTPSGEPRSSGVVYWAVGRRLFVVVGPDSWKAKHIAASGRVAVTVPVRRGGIVSLVVAIPPATISFHATATVYPPGSPQLGWLPKELTALLPAERRAEGSVVEIVPEGVFVTYGLGVSLMRMADPDVARGRVAVREEGEPR